MQSKTFFAADGTNLACFSQYVTDSKIGVIIVHGLAEHKGRYEEFVDSLTREGISVFALDLRGHGQSGGKRGDVNCFDDYLNDLDDFVQDIKTEYPQLKLALFGHSIGGLISANYAACRNMIDLLILSSPSLETPVIVKCLSLFPERLLHKINIKKRHSESKEMLAYSRNDPYACHHFSLGLLKVVFIDGVMRINKAFSRINIPTLLLGGHFDPLVNSGKLASLLEKFGSQDKTIKIYRNAKHRIVQNAAKEEAVPDIIEWLKARI